MNGSIYGSRGVMNTDTCFGCSTVIYFRPDTWDDRLRLPADCYPEKAA